MDPENTLELSLIEVRILGCLLEKEVATPDNYPLSLNSLANACNQKSNRNPVLSLEEDEVSTGLDGLRSKGLAGMIRTHGSNIPKHKHKFEELFTVSRSERAVLTELFLRGPQTPGELRTRCERLHPFGDIEAIKAALESLRDRNVPLIAELPRQLGQKDNRYAQIISGKPELLAAPQVATTTEPLKVEVAAKIPPEVEQRIATLESTVALLQKDLATFKAQFE
ncbi:MAG: YceH family protein [Verrucomicrobiota bacterium]